MGQIWQATFAIIASVGGAGAIIVAVVKFTSNILADRLSKKYEIQMNKELEAFKAGIDKKTYISRTRFDTEFQIYRELSENLLTMVNFTYWLFPNEMDRLPKKEEQNALFIDRYEKAGNAISIAQQSIRANAPFIPDNFYNQFNEICNLCLEQYRAYAWKIAPDSHMYAHELRPVFDDCSKTTIKILEKQQQLIAQLREYLGKLDALEDK